ncbi:MAG TPA: TIR domain-containing protein [Thermoanaerobaculia bacterium]
MKEKVLLADNDPEQLDTWAEVLKDAGYEVAKASSVAETQSRLMNEEFDLAILDLHMEREMDPTDKSGLNLARLYREKVPIIMWTSLPELEDAVAALKQDGRYSPAVAFVQKKDGPKVLLEEAQKAIEPKVFVSHGHDPKATAAVVNFLEHVGAHPVVLKEQPLASQTIIEAFEKYANVQFAIILMTPDDQGRVKGDAKWKPRARQNVIFELGFLLAKLGRERVVALMKAGEPVEEPSNYKGVRYREIDPYGEWQQELLKIMQAAKIRVG